MLDVVFAGEVFCDLVFGGTPHLPTPGSEVYADRFAVVAGGTATRCVAAARQGLSTGLFAVIGTDMFGEHVAAELGAVDGLDLRWLRRDPAVHTPVTVAVTNAHDRAFITYEEEGARRPETWEGELPAVRVLHLGIARPLPAWAAELRSRLPTPPARATSSPPPSSTPCCTSGRSPPDCGSPGSARRCPYRLSAAPAAPPPGKAYAPSSTGPRACPTMTGRSSKPPCRGRPGQPPRTRRNPRRRRRHESLRRNGNLPALPPAGYRPATGSVYSDVLAEWKDVSEKDGLLPYLDYTTPTFYDTLTAAVQEMMAGQQTPHSSAGPSRPTTHPSSRAGRAGTRTDGCHRTPHHHAQAPGRVQWKGYLYALPALTVLTLFLLVPLGQLVQISLYRWDGLSGSTWAGLSNYTEIAPNPQLRDGFVHSLVLILFYAVIPTALALVLAAVTTRAARLRGVSSFRAVIFLPQIVAMVVTATAWTAIYAPDGVLNTLLRAVGLKAVTRAWLGDFHTALPAVGLIGTWLEIGLCLVLFLAGIGQIPRELYEAAKVDGAGPVREFFTVTLPGLRGQLTVALTLTVIAALRTFDLVYITTHGGPGNSTSLPAFEVYNRAFNTGQAGSACAIAVVLTLIILVITFLITKLQPEDQ